MAITPRRELNNNVAKKGKLPSAKVVCQFSLLHGQNIACLEQGCLKMSEILEWIFREYIRQFLTD